MFTPTVLKTTTMSPTLSRVLDVLDGDGVE
jgi:hypothetical protein